MRALIVKAPAGRQTERHAISTYRVCVISPPGYAHSYAFAEVAVLLKASLSDLGHACDIAVNSAAPDRTNILVGYHLLNSFDGMQGCRYIVYQLEQLGPGAVELTGVMQKVLNGAESIWDYSSENILFLAERGLEARLLPLGYHAALDRVDRGADKDIDVLFYGSLNSRRKAVLDALMPALRVKALFGVYGSERDQWIARSKTVLNIHHYSARIFEAVRISYLLNNGAFVVSEESAVTPYPDVPLVFSPYDTLAGQCRYFLERPGEMARAAAAARDAFRAAYPMVSLLAAVV
ncbi:MAG: hypothetical protein GF418_08540 [Chitinivibrionales bacterium]|nr:hypothetical protein [Chitinivibrionales bacterium]MBD3395661.1 hypothetical protein [Chitinivibrionales bacterium]